MGIVYHASSSHGIKLFYPRRFWHNPDFSKSGQLDEDEVAPPGAIVTFAIFASDWDFLPFYFVPPEVTRIQINAISITEFAAGLPIRGLGECQASRVLFIEDEARSLLEHYRFSIYEFQQAAFCKLPNGEYIAKRPVAPIRETSHCNPLVELRKRDMHVEFVPVIKDYLRRLRQKRVSFDSHGCFS